MKIDIIEANRSCLCARESHLHPGRRREIWHTDLDEASLARSHPPKLRRNVDAVATTENFNCADIVVTSEAMDVNAYLLSSPDRVNDGKLASFF
jgi:hypothetical protein